MQCKFKACAKCGGDLRADEGDWRCLQCSRYYYSHDAGFLGESHIPGFRLPTRPTEDLPELLLEVSAERSDPPPGGRRRGRRPGYRARSMRSINSVIEAKATGESRWWDRNRAVIEYLDQGLPVREIARLTDRGQRQIRTVKEHLVDIRDAALA